MRRDIMENAGLTFFAEIGILLFVVVFAAILIRTLLMKKENVDHAKSLPLESGEVNDQEAC